MSKKLADHLKRRERLLEEIAARPQINPRWKKERRGEALTKYSRFRRRRMAELLKDDQSPTARQLRQDLLSLDRAQVEGGKTQAPRLNPTANKTRQLVLTEKNRLVNEARIADHNHAAIIAKRIKVSPSQVRRILKKARIR